jgi:hypothetical protein
MKYKSDFQSSVCATYLDSTALLSVTNGAHGQGKLSNDTINADARGQVACTLALHASNSNLACPTHSAYKGLFNEWRTSSIYVDLLINKNLRECCDNIFLLVERGNKTVITDVKQMITDVNHKMYKCNNNIQVITFKHIFSDTRDKLFKKINGTDDAVSENDTVYLKILAPINNQNGTEQVGANDCQISLRVKMYNQYKDMKVLTGNSISLN